MILEFDCGNTRVKWRVREGQIIHIEGSFLTSESFDQVLLTDIPLGGIKRVLVGSVLGDEHSRGVAAWSLGRLGLNPEFAISELSCNGVVNGYQQPEKLGVDRWLAILAAKSKTTASCVIVDCGSAITVDVVTSKGEHLGGYISPGLRLMREALNIKTAGIKFGATGYSDDIFPARNTVGAIKAAELVMMRGLVDQAKMVLRNYDSVDSTLYITGGDGEWLSSMLVNSIFVEDLVLDGLGVALGFSGH